jgi:2-polyprenyl-6-methoxyphenol hydroxylase-like FAD-dependent oxidoreductase
MAIVKNASMQMPGMPFVPVKFNIGPNDGECFWTPYLHKDGDDAWMLLIEAKAGGGFDRFRGVKDGHELVERIKTLIAERMPWDAAWVKDAMLADERGWLVGEVLPSIRGPVATLPSGRVAMAIGDTAMSMDPCAGQGANNGARMVRAYLASIDAAIAANGTFDAAFMSRAFEEFYRQSGEATYAFSHLLTEPMGKAGQALLMAGYGSTGSGDSGTERIAQAIAEQFVEPGPLNDCFLDEKTSMAFIGKTVGGSASWHLLKKKLAIGLGQLRQLVGLQPGHP